MSILDYIKNNWSVLTRSHANLAIAAEDPKSPGPPGARRLVYVATGEDISAIEGRLREQMQPADFQKIELRILPSNPEQIREPGLLYLPWPYVVPGGRFNEMYGWDSFFIQMGLLRDGVLGLAQDLANNALYEVREYGKVLNANRTYYLTRSQPPFLASMVLSVYRRTQDRKWLEDARPWIENYYRFMITDVGLGLFAAVDLVIGLSGQPRGPPLGQPAVLEDRHAVDRRGDSRDPGSRKGICPARLSLLRVRNDQRDYELLNFRYSCPLLTRDQISSGKVPTAPTIASMMAALEVQEALKLLHGMPVAAGSALVFNGVSNQFYSTRLPFRDDCLSHETYPKPIELELGCASTVHELFTRPGRS